MAFMPLLTTLAFLLSWILVSAQRETIWYDPVTIASQAQWQNEKGIFVTSSNCPSFGDCFSYVNGGELYSYPPTTDYHSIRVHYDLRSVNAASAVCEIWYILGQESDSWSDWTQLETISANNQAIHRALDIAGAENNTILGVSFYNTDTTGTCYLNNVTITGIPITASPTRPPSEHPTAIPSTSNPSVYPSVMPTAYHILPLCFFSDDYLKIHITFEDVHIVEWTTNTACDTIFRNSSRLSSESTCIILGDMITIDLASTARVGVHDVLTISSDIFVYLRNNERIRNDALVLTILPPQSPTQPLIIANVPSVIGICDDLILNAVHSMSLGGRSALFEWELSSSLVDYGAIVIVDADSIPINVTMDIHLYVTTWYNLTVSKTFVVYKSPKVLPHVALSGPTTYTVTNDNYNHDYIHINALISYTDDCVTQMDDVPFPYALYWSTNALIETYLDEQNVLQDVDHIAVDISLLSPGKTYIFTVHLVCINDAICDGYNTSSTLSMVYEFSAIVCSMYSADTIYLNSLTATQLLNDYLLYLDGYTMTYDPNKAEMSDKAHLTWQWECIDNHNDSCNDLFDSSSSTMSTKYITFQSDQLTQYHFTMTVHDETNANRSHCISTLDAYIGLLDDDDGNSIKYLSVMIRTSSGNVIRSNDRLRLMVMILNDQVTNDETDGYYEYKWSETNDQMTTTDLTKMNHNTGSNGNLILPENTLEKGTTYAFQVEVTKMSGGVVVGHGIAPVIEVRVMDGPRILDIIVTPSCEGLVYASLADALNAFYHISVIADGVYEPLSYAFVYSYDTEPDTEYSLHRSVLSEPYLLDARLPFGSFTLKSMVYDAKSSMVQVEIDCHITISNADPNECISFKHDVMDSFQYSSKHELLLYLLQSTEIYLHYIEKHYYVDNIDCLQVVLPQIIDVYHEYLIQNGDDMYDFCLVDWTLFMTKIFTKYINLWMQVATHVAIHLHDIELLLSSLILDPCSALTDIVHDLDLLFVSPQSMINGNAIIYYETLDHDITHLINKAIITDQTHVLYELSASVIQLASSFPKNESINLIDLLSKSLYIHTLFRISSSIPGESSVTDEYDEFEIYSTRMDPNGMVNVSVDHIQISIPSDIFNNGRDSFCDITQHVINSGDKTNCAYNSVDVIIISQNNTQTTDVPVSQPQTHCLTSTTNEDPPNATTNGTLSNAAISIIVIGGNASASHISITFDYDDEWTHTSSTNDPVECVWYDEVQRIWKDTGCITIIHNESQTIECECNHLTTFSLIHNINLDECNQLLHDIANSIAWRITHIVFCIFFACVLCHSLRELLPFIIHKKYNPIEEKALLSITLVGVISFIHIILCILFISVGSGSDWYQSSSPLKVLLTFLLLCPQWIYFVIFSIVLYSWIIVSYRSTSTSVSTEEWNTKSGKALMIASICFIVFGIVDFVFISSVELASGTYWYYALSRILWIVFTLIAMIIFTVFGYWTQLLVRRTASKLETKDIASAEIQLANKLLVVTCVIIAFFTLQCVFVVYFLIFSAFNHNHMLLWRICDLVSNLICLAFVCLLYKNTLIRLRGEAEIKPMCYKAKKRTKRFYDKYVIQYKRHKMMRQSVTSARNHSAQDSTSMAHRRSTIDIRHNTGKTETDLSQLSIPDDTATRTDSEVRDRHGSFGVYKVASVIPLPPLSETSEVHKNVKTKKKKSNKKEPKKVRSKSQLEGDELIFGRKELLQQSKIQLAKKCRLHGLPSNGTKGDIVNRLLKYQKHAATLTLEPEKSISITKSITAAETPQSPPFAISP
eukprot:533236_1